jgi:hypothetical protein
MSASGQTRQEPVATIQIWRSVLWRLREANMVTKGAAYQPELIELMKSALDEAATILPKARRTSAMKVKLASRILAAAAKGERDPIQLRIAALLEIVDDQEPPTDSSAAISDFTEARP